MGTNIPFILAVRFDTENESLDSCAAFEAAVGVAICDFAFASGAIFVTFLLHPIENIKDAHSIAQRTPILLLILPPLKIV
jgi:hypothetical protein